MTKRANAEPNIDDINQLILIDIKKQGALLPILHRLQDYYGYIPSIAIDPIAVALNQTAAEIHGVISFYHCFKTTPQGKHRIQLCRAEACQARGARKLEEHVKGQLSVNYHETTKDGMFTLDPVYCLGNCARGPTMRIDDQLFGSVDEKKFESCIDTFSTYVLELN